MRDLQGLNVRLSTFSCMSIFDKERIYIGVLKMHRSDAFDLVSGLHM
jgi:hypothetical protein